MADPELNPNDRVYLKDSGEYATVRRRLLGLKKSAILEDDLGQVKVVAGVADSHRVVKNGLRLDGVLDDVPIDFRTVGIDVLTSYAVDSDTQGRMFTNFMKDFTKNERDSYVALFETIDPQDSEQIAAFVNNMRTMLDY